MMGMETSLIPYFLGQADEDSTLQVVSDATILQANFWITGITKRLWDWYSLRRSNHAGMTRESREQCFEHSVVHSHSSTSVVANLTLFRVVTFSFFRSLFLFFGCFLAILAVPSCNFRAQHGPKMVCQWFVEFFDSCWILLSWLVFVADILAAFVCPKNSECLEVINI